MITKTDLQEAISECQGVRNPNANTCMKLAAYYTIKDHMYEEESVPVYSYAGENSNVVQIDKDNDFANLINGMNQTDAWLIIDELMSTLQIVNPRLYKSVIRKIEEG